MNKHTQAPSLSFCRHVWVHVLVGVHVLVCARVHVCVCMSALHYTARRCTAIHTRVCLCFCMHVFLSVYVSARVCMRVHVCQAENLTSKHDLVAFDAGVHYTGYLCVHTSTDACALACMDQYLQSSTSVLRVMRSPRVVTVCMHMLLSVYMHV